MPVARRRSLLASLLCLLPLLTVSVSGAQAQTQDEDEPEALVFAWGPVTEGEEAYFTVVVAYPSSRESRGRRLDRDVTVELTIAEEGNFLASGQAGKRRVTVLGSRGRDQAHFRVGTVNDNRNEANGVVSATVNPGKGYTLSADYGQATGLIRDNDVPVVDMAPGPAIAEGETATFSLTADPKPASPLQVSLTVQDGQFSPAEQLGQRTVTIGTNGRGTLQVGTADDAVDEDDGFITATIDPGAGYQVGTSASARVSVTDGGVPTPKVALSAPSAIDEGDIAIFTLSATPAPVEAVDVTVNLAEQGSFAATGEIGRRTVAVGTDGTGTFTVATENDRTAEADGSITATLAEGSGYLLRSPNQVTVAVRDTTTRVSIAAGPAITEGGTASFTLTASPHPSESFDVTVEVSESSRFTDSGETGSRTVTIGTDGIGTLTVTTSDDATLEADGTITATVSAGSGYGVGSPARASVNVADATPRVSIAAGGTIIEGDSASFTLTADPKPPATIHVDVDVSERGDFLAGGESGTRSVSIDSSGSGTLVVATDDDSADERQGSIIVRVRRSDAASYGVGVPRSASLRVNDNDPGTRGTSRRPPQLSVGDAEVLENAGRYGYPVWLEFPVSLDRSAGAFVRATFEIRTTAESATTAPATRGQDYRVFRPNHLSVSFGSGRTDATVRVQVLDDDEFEEKPETFELVVVDIRGAEIADGKAIGTIRPDPLDAPRGRPVVTISGGAAVTEGRKASFTLRAEPAPEQDLVVSLRVYDDETSDFLASADEGARTVTIKGMNDRIFAALDGVSRQNLAIDTVDDDERETDGSIRVAVERDPDPDAGGTYDPGARNHEATVEVKDNERKVPVVTILGGNPVTEGGVATFTLLADPAPENDLTVTVTVYDDPTSDFLDSAREGTRTVTIAGVDDRKFAEKRITSETLTVRTVDDDEREADGSIRVAVESDPDPGAGGEYLADARPYEASVVVKDNERGVPTVTITGGDAVSEGEPAIFTLTADPATEDDLTVTVTVYDDPTSDFLDSAREGTRTVTIRGVGDSDFARQRHTTRTLTVDTRDDGEREADGSIRVVVEIDPDPGAGGEYLADTRPYEASVVVKDNERAVSVVSIEGGDAVSEGGRATFTLTADPAPERDLAVTLSIHDDSTSDFVPADEEGTRVVTIRGVSDSDFAAQRQTILTFTVETEDDAEREADGSIHVFVEADPDAGTEGEYFADVQSLEASVDVRDNERGVPAVTITGGPAVVEGSVATFTLKADPAPEHDLTVAVHVAETGEFVADGDEGDRTVVIPGVGDSAFAKQRHTTRVLMVETVADAHVETAGEVRVTIETDADGRYDANAHPWEAVVQVRDNRTPTVSVAPPFASARSAIEGASLGFTLNVEPVSATELHVNVAVAQPGNDYVNADSDGGTGFRAVTIPARASSAVVTVDTVDDSIVEAAPGTATVTVGEGNGYLVATPPGDAASATIVNNDGLPTVSIHDRTVHEQAGYVLVSMTLSEPPTEAVRVSWAVNPLRSTATFGQDYAKRQGYKAFGPGQTEKYFSILLIDDSHDDPGEIIVIELSDPVGVVIADGEAVITIENEDPLPSAWLARFGRTVAEQALDGIAGRMAASRTAGMRGTLAGRALAFDSAASGQTAVGGATPGVPSANREAALAMADVARGLGSGASAPAGPGSEAEPFGNRFDTGLGDKRFGTSLAHPRSMTAREALLGSSFSLTREQDASGGSLAFWGRALQGRFDGAERDGTDITLDGTVTTGMLGADYARGDWLVGLALTQSSADGGRVAEGDADPCPDLDEARCDREVREMEASLTAAIPYAALQASQRLRLWGAVGYGSGEVTLKTAMGERYGADTNWHMVAAGLRGALLAPTDDTGGPALALASDALWARTSSDKTRGLAASDSDVTRLRLGLEGSYRMALAGGGSSGTGSGASLVPKVEIGARHDGGDAETGFGIELGGGIAWFDPTLGLSLDVSGRTLLVHENDDLEDRGISAQLAFDPDPATERGPSFALRQEFGGRAQGGLDALFATDSLEDRTGSGSKAISRWTAEVAYGFPAFGSRFIGSPHVGVGLAIDARDWSLGWRLTPEAASAPDISLGVKAALRESATEAPERRVGVEVHARW